MLTALTNESEFPWTESGKEESEVSGEGGREASVKRRIMPFLLCITVVFRPVRQDLLEL